MHPNHNRDPYFPENLDDYAPWVAKHGLLAPYGECQCGCGKPAPIATKSDRYRDAIKGHPYRFFARHRLWQGIEEGFWRYVPKARADECWEWQGPVASNGYGKFQSRGKTYSAHRISYELNIGLIPDGAFVCHKCDNPACVNPRHLFLGSHADNMADKVRKGRQSKGEGTRIAKLTRHDVVKIRALASAGLNGEAIARQFPVSGTTIRDILAGKTWRHVR